MENILMQKLKEMEHSYYDFYHGVPRSLKKVDGGIEKMLAELERRPDMTCSDVVEYASELLGCKKVI